MVIDHFSHMPVETKGPGAGRKKGAIGMFDMSHGECACDHTGMMKHHCGSHFGRRIIATLFGILIAYAIVLFGSMIRNNMQKFRFIGRGDVVRQITVDADAKVTAAPDVAIVSMGVVTPGPTVAEAQQKNTAVMNTIVERLKALGVDKKDIQTTNYNVYPKTKYVEKTGSIPDGFEVNQSVTVKIRDVGKAGAVVGIAGEVGANMVGGIQFQIDDPEVYRAQAREMALRKVGDKMRQLSAALGVRVLGVSFYNEYQAGGPVYDVGGPMMLEKNFALPAPAVEAGSNEIPMHVSVTFEIQ